MSERLRNMERVSNEEVIDDITKDLRASLSTNEGTAEPKLTNKQSSSRPSTLEAGCFGDKPCKHEIPILSHDFGDEAGNVNHPNSSRPPIINNEFDDDYVENEEDDDIDELALKDVEVGLTDDEKTDRKSMSEELKGFGNDAFKIGDYVLSAEKYTEGLLICPLQFPQLRAVLYCNRGAAKMKMKLYKQAANDCTKAIEFDQKYLKAYIRRAQSYEATEKYDESLADFQKILELDPSNEEARKALVRLPPLIEVRNEKMKTEMVDKLKDLGNMILRPFGLSTDNFQLQQKAGTDDYTINFKK